MNTTRHIEDELSRAMHRLCEAGVSFTVVEACPHPQCAVCRQPRVSAAA